MTQTAAPTADTATTDDIEAVFEGDEKTSEALVPVLASLKAMLDNSDEKALSIASQAVWIASRDEPWRIPIGESGILGFFQSLIPRSQSTEPTLALNALKIVGNSCAEKDANRKRVVEHPLSVAPVIAAIGTGEPETRAVAAVVLLNICTDCELAQRAAIERDACQTIFDLLDDPAFGGGLDHPLRVLEQLLSHRAGKTAAPDSALETLLAFLEAGDQSFDNTLSLISVLSSLLGSHRFQGQTLKETTTGKSLFPRILDLIEKTYRLAVDAEREAKDKSLVAYARNQIVEAVGEIADDPDFLPAYPIGKELMERVSSWLELRAGMEDLVVTACLIYGNVGQSDEVCIELVQAGVHRLLLKVVDDTTAKLEESARLVRRAREKKKKEEREEEKEEEEEEVEGADDATAAENLPTGAVSVRVIHAAVGVLKNLAIPAENKGQLVADGALRVVERMLRIEGIGVGQVWYSAVSLGRLTIVGAIENAQILLAPSASGGGSLLSLYFKRYAEVEEPPVRTEIARTIATVLRLICAEESPSSQQLLDALLSHDQTVETTLWDMVKQEKYQVVRSEGWFALALLAREPRGAARVVQTMDEELVRETLTQGGLRNDRANVGALVAELWKNSEEKRDFTDPLMRVYFREEGVAFD